MNMEKYLNLVKVQTMRNIVTFNQGWNQNKTKGGAEPLLIKLTSYFICELQS